MRHAFYTESLAIVVLVASVLFGGSAAPGRLLILIPELLSLALLTAMTARLEMPVVSLWSGSKSFRAARDALEPDSRSGSGRAPETHKTSPVRAPIPVSIIIVLALPLLQLVPLPPQLWMLFPGRSVFATAYATAGIEAPWLPISIEPSATFRFFFGLLPAAGLFLAIRSLDAKARQRLVLTALVLGLVSTLTGAVQLAAGSQSIFHFYPGASREDAVGFFANRSHFAAFLYLIMLCATALMGEGRVPRQIIALLAPALFMLFLGILATGSRAGLALGFLALAVSAIIILGRTGPAVSKRLKTAILSMTIVTLTAISAGVLFLFLHGNSGDLTADLRWRIDETVWNAVRTFFPVGTGFGTFERIYPLFEQTADLIPAVINNAHNDWLEIILEGGVPALALLIAALSYLIRNSLFRASRRRHAQLGAAADYATLAAMWLIALHSAVDYPLRTIAVSSVFGLVCGLRSRLPDHATAAAPADRGRTPAPASGLSSRRFRHSRFQLAVLRRLGPKSLYSQNSSQVVRPY